MREKETKSGLSEELVEKTVKKNRKMAVIRQMRMCYLQTRGYSYVHSFQVCELFASAIDLITK